MSLKRIIEIAKDTKQLDLVKKLEEIENTLNSTNAPLILPLVGEFSSGKTTLINALTDTKKLETAATPTTATIYEIFFGNDSSSATVINEDGTSYDVADLDDLKNEGLKDASLVEVFDTSKKISPSTVLVDTPGLSSPVSKHKEVLLDFIPNADGILLVTDINQPITKSLVDFTKTISMSNRPVYLIITKCDTKSSDDIENVKDYIHKNSELKIEKIVCVSAKNDDLTELYALLTDIDKDKSSILRSVNEQRIKNLSEILSERLDDLLKHVESSDSMEQEIKNQKDELDSLKRNIDKLINCVSTNAEDVEKEICKEFNNIVFQRLENLVISNNPNYDMQASAEINGMATQYLNRYKQKIQNIIYSVSNERQNRDLGINLSSLRELDLSQLKMGQLSYNLNLNSVGHEYDKAIAGGVKVAGAVALIGAAVAAAPVVMAAAGVGGAGAAGGVLIEGGAIAGAGGAAAGGGAAIGNAIAGAADAMLVGGYALANNAQNNKELRLLRQQEIQKQLERQKKFKDQLQNELELVDNYNQQLGEEFGCKTGLVEGIVSKVTEKTGKPQRQRIIHNYIYEILEPDFSRQLQLVTQQLLNFVRDKLNAEAECVINQKTENIKELNSKKQEAEELYKKRIHELKEYKNELISSQGENA